LRTSTPVRNFAPEFFDAVLSLDSFMYFGTDDLYLRYLARFLKPGGVVGIAMSGLVREIEGPVPGHLQEWWEPTMWCLHSAPWWRRHWERSGIMAVHSADTMPDGWQSWLQWQRTVWPANDAEIKALEADRGRLLGYVRLVASRRADAQIEEPIVSIPANYTKQPLLRSDDRDGPGGGSGRAVSDGITVINRDDS
jgi:SAM-dependent methyltransferase